MMKTLLFMIITFSLLFNACGRGHHEEGADATGMQVVMGRNDEQGGRFPVYRVKAPDNWIRRDPLPDESLIDTKKALCEFIILDEDKAIHIVLHNFPSRSPEDRIPPAAQTARWRGQFDSLDLVDTSLQPQSFSGYSGLLLTANGIMKGEATTVLGWGLQLPMEHYRALTLTATPENQRLYEQMRADVTIKATGPQSLIEKHKKTIIAFAHTFELIEEIPTRS